MTSDIVDANPDGLATNPTDYTRDMNVVSGSYSLVYVTTFGFSTRKIMSDIFPIPKTSKTVTKTAAIILFISNESIFIFFKMHI